MKKNYGNDGIRKKRSLSKVLLIMKITFLLIFLTTIQSFGTVYSQTTKLSVNLQNATLVDILDNIENQSQFRFLYNNDLIENKNYGNVKFKEKTVDEILDVLLEGSGSKYSVLVNNLIVISPDKMSGQQKTVTGTVTSESGEPLPGVTVAIKGTTQGTVTNTNGEYTLSNIPEDATLVFSFVGMHTQEVAVGNQAEINIRLEEEAIGIDEVVVTALGIQRQEKTLSYSQQKVTSDELMRTRDMNFVNSLSGITAGAEIQKSSSGAGGSTQIVLRGNKSLSGDSDPLFVIDGIPMANRKNTYQSGMTGFDQGDGLSQLNPDDIESITILKGSNAAAMYGSQGANGVVLITTKKGEEGEVKVNISSGITFDNVITIPDLQYKYGSEGGTKESWSYTPMTEYDDSFVNDFFQTGHNVINSISLSGGSNRTTAYFSYGNTSTKGTTPTNKYNRHNLTFRQSTKLWDDKLVVSSNIKVSTEQTHNRNPMNYYLNPITGLYFFPRDKDFNHYKENYQVFNEERNLYLQNWFVNDHHQSNPYWILYKEPRDDETKRLIGNVSLNYAINEKINVEVRGNYDYAVKVFERQHAAGSNPTNVPSNGRWDYHKYDDELFYADGILSYNDKFGIFSVNAVAGGSYQKTVYGDGVTVNTAAWGSGDRGTIDLLYPNEFYFQNLPPNQLVASTLSSRLEKQALFANLTVGVNEILFLDFSGRNDWASSLAGTGNESYFYPSFGLTAIFSEMFELPDFFTFGKVRASHAIVGNEVPFNRVNPQHTINDGGGITRNSTMPFTNLKPEMIKSTEVGTDLRFFNGRMNLDFTYYYINSQDQFISLPALSGSGYTNYFVNAGKIVNKGIEFTFDVTPVKTNKFSWNSAFNYSHNNNEVVKLHKELQNPISTGSLEGYESKFEVGGSIGDVYVYKFLRDEQGRIILDPGNGRPLKTAETELIGNLNPDWSLGWNNSFTYGNFMLSFLVNSKIGGVAVSQTEAMLDGTGVSKRTADARDNGGVEINAVQDGTPVNTIDAKLYYTSIGDRNGIKEPYVYDRTNIRLSQLSLSYNFDMAKLSLPLDNATLSFVGQNLFFIYKEAPFDPELAMNTTRNYQSYDNFNFPATRTLGFNLRLTF